MFDEAEHIALTEEPDIAETAPETPEDNTSESTSKKMTKPRSRRVLPSHLPRIDVTFELPVDKMFCPHDGQPLHKIGEDFSEKLEIIPAKVQVVRYRRFKYGCRCCEDGVHLADIPKQALPKSNATAATLAFVTVSKYQDALPLHRLEKMFKRNEILIPRHTMAGWMIKLGKDWPLLLLKCGIIYLLSRSFITTKQLIKY